MRRITMAGKRIRLLQMQEGLRIKGCSPGCGLWTGPDGVATAAYGIVAVVLWPCKVPGYGIQPLRGWAEYCKTLLNETGRFSIIQPDSQTIVAGDHWTH
ncbi:MAG: hypothetical protein ACLQNE_34875 [Thermoguttaceae bacterium]